MTFDDYLENQDHIAIEYYDESFKRVLFLDGVDLKGVNFIIYFKYDAENDYIYPHREDGPAYIKYDKDGAINQETWYENDNIHREDGPALVSYYKSGDVSVKTWYKNNQPHRLNGPAKIFYGESGKILIENFWINGNEYTKNKYLELGGKL